MKRKKTGDLITIDVLMNEEKRCRCNCHGTAGNFYRHSSCRNRKSTWITEYNLSLVAWIGWNNNNEGYSLTEGRTWQYTYISAKHISVALALYASTK